MMRDQVVDIDLAFHVPVDDLRHIRAPARAAERRAFPLASRDELERTRADLLPRRRHADDERLAPALVRAFERLTHQRRIADAFERIVRAAIGQLHDMVDDVLHFLRVDEVRHAELLRELHAPRIDIDTDDLVRADHLRALDHVQADAAETEHDYIRPRFHLRRIHDRADARRHAAADVADLVERRVFTHFRHRNLRHHDVVRERRRAHVVEQRLAIEREA
ncbi:hypothetical protein AWB79_07619 [Caballeronia hypogeia]|uniref:Uncharacterized protein n=1 Tax=Caballeronia hypogeia TaxID=1777140 RepID=A0A158DVY2_9BURK|nr:hypothetical protein AWB79_07619 [Caballeronia hypogeia]